MGVSEDDADQNSNSENNSQDTITDSSPKSVMGDDCLTCWDTEDAAVKLAHEEFHKKVWASCGPTNQGLWKDAQLEQIGNICTIVWGSDYKAIETDRISLWTGAPVPS